MDEGALLAALKKGELAGAALDTLADESNISALRPLVRQLQETPNGILTPHLRGNTWDSVERTEMFMVGKLKSFFGMEERREN